jgi:hypothetical protein
MTRMSRPVCNSEELDLAVVHGRAPSFEREKCLPAGHCLSRARFCRLRQSDWIIVAHGARPVGLAAYKRADSDVRVVHELLVERTLPVAKAVSVIDALIVSLEMVAYDECVDCLMFMLLRQDVSIPRFESHGYRVIAADPCGAWLQKKLDRLDWALNSPGQPS